jgi:hypothetical protein
MLITVIPQVYNPAAHSQIRWKETEASYHLLSNEMAASFFLQKLKFDCWDCIVIDFMEERATSMAWKLSTVSLIFLPYCTFFKPTLDIIPPKKCLPPHMKF